ncbi:hypothetical protein TEA_027181 [Camellia sinensis var. sinensis]|uniref:Polygalacturonase n=1 Tax=Camellia sinensis var. sinensis TaxID=542762 RepID=A0A4S4E7Q2_CAMSN|nr:hypothetical protein TEA_027181 [Camellia sinensis var. sinensis]
MRRNFSVRSPAFALLIALLAWSLNYGTCIAREGKLSWNGSGRVSRVSRLMKEGRTMQAEPTRMVLQTGANSDNFNVLDYGAKGDGNTDDTKAFEAAWADACQVEASTMVVPSGSVFLLNPISFSGSNCKSNIVFQLDGKIIATTSSDAWGSGTLQWLEFTKLQGITVRGKGVVDGQGSVWWNNSPADNPTNKLESAASSTRESNYSNSRDSVNCSNFCQAYFDAKGHHLTQMPVPGRIFNRTPDLIACQITSEATGKMPSTMPTALRFYGSSDVTVTGIMIQNSPKTHLKFDTCTTVQVFDMRVSSPGDSPNTDGIHLQNSQDVVIHSTSLACGDDCVSIQTGCSGVYIHNVNCGPGHGISIGGLGRDNTKACVSNVTVRDSTMSNTLTGVRIKTWQGGSGSVQGIMFSNIQVSEVETPVMIDQYYCDGNKCQNETSAVAISGISYQNIIGTYTVKPVHFACSDSLPCTGITLSTIQLKAIQLENNNLNEPFCWQTYGVSKTTTTPPIDCLKMGKPSTNRVQSNADSC